ncbi:MAG: hypothetical protein Q9182_001756 [Xanthomendoza sp. 2 TL-2023]
MSTLPPPSLSTTTTTTPNILTHPPAKLFLLTLHHHTLYTLPQTLAIMQHKFHHPYTTLDIQAALSTLRDEQDGMYLQLRQTGKVEYMWFPKRAEVREAERIEEVLRGAGRWV